MNTKKLLNLSPRVLAIGVALFLMLFSFDVFGPGLSVWEMALGFLIHNIPSILLALVIWVSWKRPWIGAVLTIVLGFAYIILTRGNQPLVAYLAISGPLFLTGILYLLSWRQISKQQHDNSHNQA